MLFLGIQKEVYRLTNWDARLAILRGDVMDLSKRLQVALEERKRINILYADNPDDPVMTQRLNAAKCEGERAIRQYEAAVKRLQDLAQKIN